MLNRSCIYIYTYTYFPSPRGTRKIKFQVFQKSSGFWSPWMLSPLEFSEKTQVFNIEPSMAMLAKPGVLERLPPTPLPLTAPWAEPATTAEIPTWKLASLRYSPRSIWQILRKKTAISPRFCRSFWQILFDVSTASKAESTDTYKASTIWCFTTDPTLRQFGAVCFIGVFHPPQGSTGFPPFGNTRALFSRCYRFTTKVRSFGVKKGQMPDFRGGLAPVDW